MLHLFMYCYIIELLDLNNLSCLSENFLSVLLFTGTGRLKSNIQKIKYTNADGLKFITLYLVIFFTTIL